MTDILVAPATVEPLTRTQAKAQARISISDEDDLVDRLIQTARAHVEKVTGRALVLQNRRLYLDEFPESGCIEIYRAPVRAVQSIQYLDSAGATQTLATTQYRLDKHSIPARITEAVDVSWPETYDVPNAVWVNYTAGHLVPFTASDSTDTLTAAGHGFADADVSQVQTLGGALPTGLSALTNYYVRDAAADTLKLSATSGGSAIDITAAGTAPNVLGSLPPEIVHAMVLLIAHWNENREALMVGTIQAETALGVADLLAPYRISRF